MENFGTMIDSYWNKMTDSAKSLIFLIFFGILFFLSICVIVNSWVPLIGSVIIIGGVSFIFLTVHVLMSLEENGFWKK